MTTVERDRDGADCYLARSYVVQYDPPRAPLSGGDPPGEVDAVMVSRDRFAGK